MRWHNFEAILVRIVPELWDAYVHNSGIMGHS